MGMLRNLFESNVKRLFGSAGLELSWRKSSLSPLVYHRIDLLLDVGANIGQYAQRARQEGYTKRIVSIEPSSEAHAILTRTAQSDPLWTVHERCALGAAMGERTLNISGNSQSSSLLDMLPAHVTAASSSAYVGREQTPIVTLDSLIERYRTANERVFVKIDTQGFEQEVLDGAKSSLADISGVQVELSLVPLYESQELYDYFLRRLEAQGFRLWSVIPGFSSPTTGQLLQMDAIMLR
jgi:FkbM family methyltransferase